MLTPNGLSLNPFRRSFDEYVLPGAKLLSSKPSHHHKLLTTHACAKILLAQVMTENSRKGHPHFIALIVAILVIDALKIIKSHQDRQRTTLLLYFGKKAPCLFKQGTPIGQTC